MLWVRIVPILVASETVHPLKNTSIWSIAADLSYLHLVSASIADLTNCQLWVY